MLSLKVFPAAIVLWMTAAGAPSGFATAPSATPPATPGPAKGPAAPLGVAMVANAPDSITLAWYRPADEVKSYIIYAGSAKEGEFKRIASVTDRTFTHSKLPADASYFYRVSAVTAEGESEQSKPVNGFTFTRCAGAPFPVRVAKNMCVTLGATVVSTPEPSAGKLADLVDGSDATSATLTGECEVKIKLNPSVPIADASYLLLNFRTDMSGQGYAYNINWRALKNYVVIESHDSTNGSDGTWTEVVSGTNKYLDGVVVIPNHQPKWIGIRNSGSLQLCRLDVFRAAPAGFRNDYWIFTGDSLVVQDFAGGSPEKHSVWFSDLVRQRHPDRYPILVQSSQGGEMMENTLGRLKGTLASLSPPNGTSTPTATLVCWESGFNDVGIGGGLWMGKKIIKTLTDAQEVCETNGLIFVPVRLEYSTGYLNKETLEPAKYNIFHNTLAVNLAGVDVFCRTRTPYACDPATQLPYADYWTYIRQNYATALAKDGVHHTKAGSDGINQLWAEIAGKMVYATGASR
ncbi:MAG: hypothetical protein K0R17_248 [Rariglobus sp.]|jgi:hypothetical protein|nr:hypothetical protein [Rariglobus sp.]